MDKDNQIKKLEICKNKCEKLINMVYNIAHPEQYQIK